MLKHIPTILVQELVMYLMEVGHGDEVVIADANFLPIGLVSGLFAVTVTEFSAAGCSLGCLHHGYL